MKHILTIGFVATFIVASVFLLWPKKTQPTQTEIPQKAQKPISIPILVIPSQLIIQSIGVNTHIESVETTGSAMAVPNLPDDVGWYAQGTRPGDVGNAVLDGHVNWIHGQGAVFENLYKIKIQDIVRVLDTDGTIHYFKVREIKKYAFDADTFDVFYSHDGRAHLVMITCDIASWNAITKTDDTRLVIFADKTN